MTADHDTGLAGAACTGHPAPLWDDHVHGETPDQRAARHAAAKAICGGCPVRAACAALRLDDDGGIWAGHLYHGRGHAVDTMPSRAHTGGSGGTPRLTPKAAVDQARPCRSCRAPTISVHAWRRFEHLQAGYRPHMGRGLCQKCYDRERYDQRVGRSKRRVATRQEVA